MHGGFALPVQAQGLACAGRGRGKGRGGCYVRKRVQRAIRVVVIMIAIAAGTPHAGPLALGSAHRTSDGWTAAQVGTGDHRRTGGTGGSAVGVRCRWRPSGADGGRRLRKDRAGGETKGCASGRRGGSGARDRWAVTRMRAGVMRGTTARGWCGCIWDGGG